MLTPEQRIALETMIDRDDLASVLSEIATICQGKAEHLASNWQDRKSAALWERAAVTIESISIRDTIRAVSLTYDNRVSPFMHR